MTHAREYAAAMVGGNCPDCYWFVQISIEELYAQWGYEYMKQWTIGGVCTLFPMQHFHSNTREGFSFVPVHHENWCGQFRKMTEAERAMKGLQK